MILTAADNTVCLINLQSSTLTHDFASNPSKLRRTLRLTVNFNTNYSSLIDCQKNQTSTILTTEEVLLPPHLVPIGVFPCTFNIGLFKKAVKSSTMSLYTPMKPAFKRQLPKNTKPNFLVTSNNKINLAGATKSKRFTEIKKEQSDSVRKIVLKYVSLILVGYLVYFFFLSHFFRLEYLVISGNDQIPSAEIEPIIWKSLSGHKWLIFPKDNYFFASPKDITTEVAKNFVVNSLTIKKQLPKTLTIEIQEKSPRFIWSTNNNYYVMTGDGLIIRKLDNYQPQKAIPMIIDQSNASTSVNEIVSNSQILSLIGSVKQNLDDNPIANLTIASFQLADRGSRFIQLTTDQGTRIHIGQDLDLVEQLTKLRKIIETNHLDLAKVDYINLQIPEQAIYKLK